MDLNEYLTLKNTLDCYDYKIIKMSEIIIRAYKEEHPNLELPYDIDELINERNAKRERINELEGD